MTALKHDSLVGQDLAGLVPGRSVLLSLSDVRHYRKAGGLMIAEAPVGTVISTDAVWYRAENGNKAFGPSHAFTYIGELQDDGFITCPEGGWTGNPVPGMRVDFRLRGFGTMVHETSELSDALQWNTGKPGRPQDIIAFRPTPAGDLGALQPQGASVSTEKTDGPAALLPCPFCGAASDELMMFHDGEGTERRIQCAVCNIEAPFYDTEDEATAAWNRRPAPVPASQVGMEAEGRNAPKSPAGEVERLRAALTGLLSVIDAAGLHNLSNGVQLGQTVWFVKATDAINAAAAALEASQ